MASLLADLGYEVLNLEDGVYHLRAPTLSEPSPSFVALLLTPYPPQWPRLPTQLFVQEVQGFAQTRDVTEHWKTLDARRLEESGLIALDIELEVGVASSCKPQVMQKPSDAGLRFALELPQGDVVCFN